jgi:hypothetical protein
MTPGFVGIGARPPKGRNMMYDRIAHGVCLASQYTTRNLRRIAGRSLQRRFQEVHGYPLNLDKPRSLSEKIQWIKLHRDLRPLAPFVDKYAVRAFVKTRIGEEYLVPLIGIYDRFADTDIDALPGAFALKTTHGCGWNVIAEDKSRVDWKAVRRKVNRWLRSDYSLLYGEACYKGLKGRIMIEKYLEDSPGRLNDYKFYCCNGEPLGLHVDIDRFGNHGYRIFDAGWNEFAKTGDTGGDIPHIPRPHRLNELLDVCRKLSAGFSYVRVDLYYVDDRIFFGELTFTPGDGMSRFDPVESDYFFGEPLDVGDYVAGLQR